MKPWVLSAAAGIAGAVLMCLAAFRVDTTLGLAVAGGFLLFVSWAMGAD